LSEILTKKRRQTKLKRSEAYTPCSVCDGVQFKDSKFVGCYCLKDLAKSTKTTAQKDGFLVEFGPEWSDDDISVLLDMVRCDG
jgi:hypothetical protein